MNPPRTDGYCSDCDQSIPIYQVAPGGLGYVSPLSDELPHSVKEVMLLGEKAFQAIPRPVCMACYCIAWEKAYPDKGPCHLREISDFIHADLERAYRFGLVLSAPIKIQEPIKVEGVTSDAS